MRVPFLRGCVFEAAHAEDPAHRIRLIDAGIEAFGSFIELCRQYALVDEQYSHLFPESSADDVPSSAVTNPFAVREARVRMFRLEQQLGSELARLLSARTAMADEETIRQLYLAQLRMDIHNTDSSVRSLREEREIVLFAAENPDEARKAVRQHQAPPEKPPMMLTFDRETIAKSVFAFPPQMRGVIPLDEYARVVQERLAAQQEGNFSAAGRLVSTGSDRMKPGETEEERLDREEHEKGLKFEAAADDARALEKQRKQDEFFDDHRRGYGNTFNRS
eukprot:gnl/Ergobibamus_cyprinoides/332.p1 GENE.gnl/Ergobibamus_cyprinoides/332~~gnl/Ergobibamus_cyprinoides/332.p1  ORF type:complete len:277 (+),score=49.98 gnl/Ergobibamus_cyprinoides/332:402-1232(+)